MRRGFSLRTEVETLSTYEPLNQIPVAGNPRRRVWEWAAFVGIKKEFKVFKNIRGSVQVMYDVYSLFVPQNINIYGDPLALRIGFEFPTQKKRKSFEK